MVESYDLVFNVDGIASHFSAIPMPKDGSCLFRSLSSILTGSHIHHHRFRQAVIEHVGLNWTTFCALTAAPDGNNYVSKDAYLLSMSLNETFGSYCELLAASQIFFLKFYVFYQDGSMNKIGDENYEQVGYLLFSGDLYSGHFDVLKPNSSEKIFSQSLNLSTIKKKRRCRVRNEIRVNQLNLAKNSYVQRKPEVNRRSVRNYTLKNPEVNQKSVKKYTSKNPEVHQKSVKKYSSKNPEVHQKSVKKYSSKNPEVHQKSVKKYSSKNPEVHQKSVKKYSSKNPEVNQKSVKKYAKKNPQMNRRAVKNYYREHPEIHLSSALKYQKKNPEKHLESMKKYAISNPEKISTSHVIRNVKKRNEKNENCDPKYLSGFSYDPSFNYSADEVVTIGKMKHICNWCKALKWKDENPGMCCLNGKVSLPLPKELPEPLLSLITGTHRDSEHFLSSLGKYNACFQMTSFGANEVTFENFRPTFKVQGQVYHLIGSLYPASYAKPSFLQIYFVGDEVEESDLRKDVCSGLKDDLLLELQKMLHLHNIYITEFKAVIDSFSENSDFKVVIRADRKPAGGHKGLYNEPTVGEVAAVIVGESFEPRDIVLHKRSDKITRISEINKGYDSLQYPLMFCFGEDGYSINIPMINPTTNSILKKTVSCKSFYAYKLMVRINSENHILRYRNLFNKYLVDMYAKIESERLRYFRSNQKKLRVEQYNNLQDAISKKDSNLNDIGKLFILPSSFTGGPRYLHERTQDAMTYVRHYGKPDLFITLTCNPKWNDITENLLPNQKSYHRHDLIARVFKLKVDKLMHLLTKSKIFGDVKCYACTIEWQKRGLPHVHLLLWLVTKINPNDVDKLISAEIPDPKQDSELYELVKSHMIHGPCGPINPHSPCMVNGKCSKHFPRKLITNTQISNDGYPSYRRRSPEDGGHVVTIRGMELDNSWVVPYSPVLLRFLESHCNAELCMSIKSIQYILKYIHKGSDQASFTIKNEFDEISRYETGRYISSSEAAWRIFGFEIHRHYPPITHLTVHLENGQRVTFNPESSTEKLTRPKNSTLMAFFDLCNIDEFAKTLYYFEVPQYYTWQPLTNSWQRRIIGKKIDSFQGVVKSDCLGRVYTVHPSNEECYHLRLLLHKVKGPTSFQFLRTFEGKTYHTYKDACMAMGLLENDNHWDLALEEAALSDSPKKLRDLFVIILTFCNVSNAIVLWNKHKSNMCGDIKYQYHLRNIDINSKHSIVSIENDCLLLLKDNILSTSGKTMSFYGLPEPRENSEVRLNADLLNETTYDKNVLSREIIEKQPLLNCDQVVVYETVLASVDNKAGNVYFLDAPGGTGKTFVMNLLLAQVRNSNKIAIAVASSGISATLLQGGRTAHSALKIPLNLQISEPVTCNITKQSNIAAVFRIMDLLVWDEATMSNKLGIEAVDSLFRDIRNTDKPFGGVTVLFSGDFRQTLPVIPRGTRADEINSCLKKSYLWKYITVLKLRKNMRVQISDQKDATNFSDELLQIGNGTLPEEDGKIKISETLGTICSTVDQCLKNVYGDLKSIHTKSVSWLKERAVLSLKNTTIHDINSLIIENFPSEGTRYYSIDTVIEEDDIVRYPVEFLNSLQPSGLPCHKLSLKVGIPIMLLRNLKPPKLCNGTRLRVHNLSKNVIEATIITGCGEGENIFIPRMPLICKDYPFEFKRLQFPVKPCFAITINKSQGQTFKVVGVDLREDCFSHGQLYVAFSRVTSPGGLYILQPEGVTKNIVYKEVLSEF